MRKLLVILVVSSLFLTQCYTQNEYLTKDYTFNTEDDLKKVVLTDGTEREFSFNQFRYKVESDSLLITYSSRREPFGNQFRIVSVTDTLTLKEIHSFLISEYNGGQTFLFIALGLVAILGIAIWANGGIMGDESLLSGMGSF